MSEYSARLEFHDESDIEPERACPPIWQSPPETFMLDGKQHVLLTSNGSWYMFVLN